LWVRLLLFSPGLAQEESRFIEKLAVSGLAIPFEQTIASISASASSNGSGRGCVGGTYACGTTSVENELR
jgi:hypothetical protein